MPFRHRLKQLARIVAAVGFTAVGGLHFVHPETFIRIVPPGLPTPGLLVVLSGVAEIAGGFGLLMPRLRRWAAIGLILLLIAVFPANLYMALAADRFADVAPAWMLYLRLPLQAVMIVWVAWVGVTSRESVAA